MAKSLARVAPAEIVAAETPPTSFLLPHLAVPDVEQAAAWEAHRAGIIQSLCAADPFEVALAERAAALLWRLARVNRSETEQIALQQERVESDLAQRRKHDSSRNPDAACHPEDVRGDVEHHAQMARLLRRLPKLQDRAKLSGEDASFLLWELARTAVVDLEEYPLPGVPDDAVLEELTGWTAGRVRECLRAICEANPDDPAELLAIALEHAEQQLRLARFHAEQVERDLLRLRRERLLPDSAIIEKHSRFEAHLSRELAGVLAQLERRQSGRMLQIDSPYSHAGRQWLDTMSTYGQSE